MVFSLFCTELSASPPSQESLRRLPWCTCVSASASQSRAQSCAQCRAREFCSKILFSPGERTVRGQPADMAQRAGYESSSDIGVFAKLTNAYCLTAIGGSQNFYSVFEQELAEHIPVPRPARRHRKGRGSLSRRHALRWCKPPSLGRASSAVSSWATRTGWSFRAPRRTRSCSISATRCPRGS